MQTVLRLIKSAIKRYPNKIAIISDGNALTYQKLGREIDSFARFLLLSGLSYQEKVAIFLPNSPLFIISFFALAKIGARVVTLNINYKENELNNYLTLLKIKYIISSQQIKDRFKSSIKKMPVKFIAIDSHDKLYSKLIKKNRNNIKIAPRRELLYQFSSGSTGKPKLACRTDANILNEAISVAKTVKINSRDNILCAVPLFHAYGFGSAMTPSIYSGASLILLNKFNPRQALKVLEQNKITIFFGVPYMFSMLSDVSLKKKIDLSQLKYCFSAGISLPSEVSEKFYRKFGIYVRDLYGTTETGCICVNLNKNIKSTLSSVGRAIEGTTVDIRMENSEKAQVGVGEIAVKATTCANYYYLGDLKKPLIKNGYFYTGDIGKKDKKNNLYILGRKTSFINVAGEKVDPKEVEGVLKQYKKVKEVVVLGSFDRLRGEVVKAIIVPKGAFSYKSSIIKYCRERLADFKVPRIVEFRDKIPKNALGKILKGYLQ